MKRPPPKKERRACDSAPVPTDLNLSRGYHFDLALQALYQSQWGREARRIFAEWLRTGDWRHLAAVRRHCAGMDAQMRRKVSRHGR